MTVLLRGSLACLAAGAALLLAAHHLNRQARTTS